MPKLKIERYTADEIRECQEGAPNQDCADCQCTVNECLDNLEAVRYQKHEPI